MRSYRRCRLLVPVLLCALAALAARPTAADKEPGAGGDTGISAEVARLYEDAAVATQQYEAGRKEADEQRAKAQRAEALLDTQRRHIAGLNEDLGRIARAQYRSSGGLPVAAQLILADSPDDLMRGQHAFSQTNLAVNNAISKSRRAEARLTADEAKAAAEWQALEKRNIQLADLKAGIEQKLEEARSQLQGQADASVAAGACRGPSGSTSRIRGSRVRGSRPWRRTSCPRPTAAAGRGGRAGTPGRTSRCRSARRCGPWGRAGW